MNAGSFRRTISLAITWAFGGEFDVLSERHTLARDAKGSSLQMCNLYRMEDKDWVSKWAQDG